MQIQFDESFQKSIKSIKDKKLKARLSELILTFQDAQNLSEVAGVKKLQGFKNYYRVRLGDYRVGFELLEDKSVLFIVVAHRKEIYKYFP